MSKKYPFWIVALSMLLQLDRRKYVAVGVAALAIPIFYLQWAVGPSWWVAVAIYAGLVLLLIGGNLSWDLWFHVRMNKASTKLLNSPPLSDLLVQNFERKYNFIIGAEVHQYPVHLAPATVPNKAAVLAVSIITKNHERAKDKFDIGGVVFYKNDHGEELVYSAFIDDYQSSYTSQQLTYLLERTIGTFKEWGLEPGVITDSSK